MALAALQRSLSGAARRAAARAALARGLSGEITPERYQEVMAIAEKAKRANRTPSTMPTSMTDVLPPLDMYEPEDLSEFGALADMPEEHRRRTVIIRPRVKRTTSSARARAYQWELKWAEGEKWTNPLMGWSSTADPMSFSIPFDSPEQAAYFAQKQGWKYEIGQEFAPKQDFGETQYKHNFLPKMVERRVKAEGKKTKEFFNPGYGASHWKPSLNFHGSGNARQHGPTTTSED